MTVVILGRYPMSMILTLLYESNSNTRTQHISMKRCLNRNDAIDICSDYLMHILHHSIRSMHCFCLSWTTNTDHRRSSLGSHIP